MSYDLTIRADRDYTHFTPLVALAEFIGQIPHVRSHGPSSFVLEEPPRLHMNISLEVADQNGDSVAAHEASGERVNCIRLHIPYANLGVEAERDYFPVALDIARFAGMRLHDAQTGVYIVPSSPPDPTRGDFSQEVLHTLGIASVSGPSPGLAPTPKLRKKKPARTAVKPRSASKGASAKTRAAKAARATARPARKEKDETKPPRKQKTADESEDKKKDKNRDKTKNKKKK